MQFGFTIVCLIILSLCHHGLAMEPLADSRMSSQILKRGDKKINGQLFRISKREGQDKHILFRISKRKEQERIIPVLEGRFHRFLLKYDT
jgi:hypothetical protein